MKLPLDESLGASALTKLPMQIPSVSSYSSSDSVADFGSGSNSKSPSGFKLGSGCGSSIGSAPGSCSGSGSGSGSGLESRSCSSSEFDSGLGPEDSDNPAKDSATSGASALREATSSESVVCAGPGKLRKDSVPPPSLAPPSSPANTYGGCNATRLERNPSAKAAATASAISIFDPSIPLVLCSKPNEVSAADMAERAGELAGDEAMSAGVIAGERRTAREPAEEVVGADDGRKKQEEVEKTRYSYIQIIGPGTSKKATAAKRITFIEPGASPVKLCMAVGEPGDYYVMLTSSCKWTGMHRVEGGPGPTDPVQTASFNVSEALFSDHHGRRITHSVCSKCGFSSISRNRRTIRDAVDCPIKVRMPSPRGFGSAGLIVSADLAINVLAPKLTTTRCQACSDPETDVGLEYSIGPQLASFNPLPHPQVTLLGATTPRASPDNIASTEGSDASRVAVTMDSATARDKLGPSTAKVPLRPVLSPHSDGVGSSLAYTESEIVRPISSAIGTVAPLLHSTQSMLASSVRPVPPVDSLERPSSPSSDGTKLSMFRSATEVIPAFCHGAILVEAGPPPLVGCTVAAPKKDKHLVDTSLGSPSPFAIPSPDARDSSAADEDNCSSVQNSEQGVSAEDLPNNHVGLSHDASEAYVTDVVGNMNCVLVTGRNKVVAAPVASPAPSQAAAESNVKSAFANQMVNRAVFNAERPHASAATSSASLSSTQIIETAATSNNGDAQPSGMRDGKDLDVDTRKDVRKALIDSEVETAGASISEHSRPFIGIPSLGFYPMLAGCQASHMSNGDEELDPDYVGVAADPVFEGVIDPNRFEDVQHSELDEKEVENRDEVRQEGSQGEEVAESGDMQGGAGKEAGEVDACSGLANGAQPSQMPQDRSGSHRLSTRKELLSRALEAPAPKVSASKTPQQMILIIPAQAVASEISSVTSQVNKLVELKRALLMLSRMKRLASPTRTLLNIAHYLREEAKRAEASRAVDPYDLRLFREELDREQRSIEMATVQSSEVTVSRAGVGAMTPEEPQTKGLDKGPALARRVSAPTPTTDICGSSAGSSGVSIATSAAERDRGVARGGFSSRATSPPRSAPRVFSHSNGASISANRSRPADHMLPETLPMEEAFVVSANLPRGGHSNDNSAAKCTLLADETARSNSGPGSSNLPCPEDTGLCPKCGAVGWDKCSGHTHRSADGCAQPPTKYGPCRVCLWHPDSTGHGDSRENSDGFPPKGNESPRISDPVSTNHGSTFMTNHQAPRVFSHSNGAPLNANRSRPADHMLPETLPMEEAFVVSANLPRGGQSNGNSAAKCTSLADETARSNSGPGSSNLPCPEDTGLCPKCGAVGWDKCSGHTHRSADGCAQPPTKYGPCRVCLWHPDSTGHGDSRENSDGFTPKGNESPRISDPVSTSHGSTFMTNHQGEAEEPETRPIQALLMPTAAGGGDQGASHERVPETRQTIDTSINSNAATSATANKSLLLPVQTNIANRPSTFATSDRSFHGLVYPTFERVSAPALGHKPCSEKINDIVGYAPSGSISEATVKDALAAGKDIDAMPAPARRAAPCALSQSFSLQPMVMSSATVSEPLAVAEISRAAASVPLGMREVSNKQVQSSALPTSASILQCASLPSSTRPIRDITQVCLAEDETTSCRNSSKATSQARVEMPREWHVAGNDLSLSPSRDERGKTSRTVSAPQTNEANKRPVDGVLVERLAEEDRVKQTDKFCSAEAGVASAEPRCEQQSPRTQDESRKNLLMRRAILNAELLHLHFRWSEGRPRSGNDILDRLYLAEGDPIVPNSMLRNAPIQGHPLPFDALFPDDDEESPMVASSETPIVAAESSSKAPPSSAVATCNADHDPGVGPKKRPRHYT